MKLDGHPLVKFVFGDGLTDSAKLQAGGYALNGGHAFPGKTFITLCRDKSGKATGFTVQLAYYKFSGNVIHAYGVNAQNTSPVSGSSSVDMSSLWEGSAAASATASSKVVNRLQLSR